MEIRFEGVRFRRGPRFLLDVPELTIGGGRVTALLGPNGSGKSTLLRLAAGLEPPDDGSVLLDGAPARRDRRTRNAIAYAFQRPVFVTGTVGQNLRLALRLRGVGEAERSKRIEAVAEAAGIGHLIGQEARRLSGGEAQRVNLARALALQAPVTLLDEPLSGLDSSVRLQLLHEIPALLAAFASTTIVVTHDRDEAMRLADDLVVLANGRLRAAGEKVGLFRAPPTPEVAELLGYTVLRAPSGPVGVAPGALAVGPGDVTFEMTVESVANLGMRYEATGVIAGSRVTATVVEGGAIPGTRISVGAPTDSVVRWGREGCETTVETH